MKIEFKTIACQSPIEIQREIETKIQILIEIENQTKFESTIWM